MIEARRLYQRLLEVPFPRLGKQVGDFVLYDSILAGYADRLAEGVPLDDPHASEVAADNETLRVVAEIRAKKSRTEEEQEFLDYFALLEEIRIVVVAAARGNAR